MKQPFKPLPRSLFRIAVHGGLLCLLCVIYLAIRDDDWFTAIILIAGVILTIFGLHENGQNELTKYKCRLYDLNLAIRERSRLDEASHVDVYMLADLIDELDSTTYGQVVKLIADGMSYPAIMHEIKLKNVKRLDDFILDEPH